MTIETASHLGMCFGVRDALRATHAIATRNPVTLLGQLVHNPLVDRFLESVGVRQSRSPDASDVRTADVIVSAHGVSDTRRGELAKAGFQVTDTTCPLVRKAHDALRMLVSEGYFPVVIGQAEHVEVRGLTGDHPQAVVILSAADVEAIPDARRFGVIAQTTQPVERVLALVEAVKRVRPGREVRFVDTVCHPTKQRQSALERLCSRNELIVVVGGRNSNNTRQLVEKAASLGRRVIHIERAEELQTGDFRGIGSVGVTAGTSTLDETVQAVVERLRVIAAEMKAPPAHEFLRAAFGIRAAV